MIGTSSQIYDETSDDQAQDEGDLDEGKPELALSEPANSLEEKSKRPVRIRVDWR